jgi:hypothetical protein
LFKVENGIKTVEAEQRLTRERRDYPAFLYRKIPYNPAPCCVELEEIPHSMRRMAESAIAGKDAHFRLTRIGMDQRSRSGAL